MEVVLNKRIMCKKLRQRLVRFRSLFIKWRRDVPLCCRNYQELVVHFSSMSRVKGVLGGQVQLGWDVFVICSKASSSALDPGPRRLQSCQHTSHSQSLPLLGTATEHRDELNWFINAWNKKSFVCFFKFQDLILTNKLLTVNTTYEEFCHFIYWYCSYLLL